ncbi:MAG: Inner rane component of cytoplasmic domain [Thermoplasmata archaeon]|nr:Inner rane component of cytoplasmic domain [Thermoplasmata archaeon]
MDAEGVDVDRLSGQLKALAHPARLDLLRLLRRPSAPLDVVVRPRRADPNLQAERAMSRQGVDEHLRPLLRAGVVTRVEGEGPPRYVTSAQRLFALVEDLRSLTALEPEMRVDVNATLAARPAEAPLWPAAPRLVLLGGPWEGRAFPLAGPGPWSVGRSRERDVALTYDPFASAEQARVERDAEGGFRLVSEPAARNPARLNFAPLPPGEARGLRAGDIIGAGRSHLIAQL